MTSHRQSGRLAVVEQQKVLDSDQRARRLKRQLENLDKDNYQEDPHAHLQWHKKIPKFDDEEIPGVKQKAGKKRPAANDPNESNPAAKRRKKLRTEHAKQRFRKTFEQMMEETSARNNSGVNGSQDAEVGKAGYEAAAARPNSKPPRKFCPPCGHFANYTCIRCGTGYCSIKCRDVHNDTRCMKYTI